MAELNNVAPAPAAAPVTPAPAAPATPGNPGDPTAVLSGDSLLGGGNPPADPATLAAPVTPDPVVDVTKIPGYNKAESDKAITDRLTAEGKTQTEIQAAIAEADKAAIESAKPGAPAEYKDFVVDPTVPMDAEMVKNFKEVAKGLNLNQQQAQGLVDLQTKYAKMQGEAVLNSFRQTVDSWKQETVLALGPGYKEELGIAAKAIERFGTPELRQLLNDTGLGNQKDVVMFFNKIGKAISEDSFADGGRSKGGSKSDGEIFYPGMPK